MNDGGAWRSARLERAAEAGEWWRVREILRGSVGFTPYDPALYREYGDLLLRLGDAMEAGKYLFLAGSSDPGHAGAIELYLRRHARCDWREFRSNWPARARHAPVDALPEPVRGYLRERGMPDGWSPPQPEPAPQHASDRFDWRGPACCAGLLPACCAGLLAAAILAIVGFVTVIDALLGRP